MRFWIAALIIALVLVVGFSLSIPHTHDAGGALPKSASVVTPLVSLHDSYSKGAHNITGSIEAPTACTDVSADATVAQGVASTSPDVINISISMPPDAGVCLAEPTLTTWSASASAAKDAQIVVSVNGVAASTTLK